MFCQCCVSKGTDFGEHGCGGEPSYGERIRDSGEFAVAFGNFVSGAGEPGFS